MIRKEKFVAGEYYHIYNRTVFKIPEFKDNGNAKKLAQNFLLANSTKSSQAFDYLRSNKTSTVERALEIAKQGEKLTEILCYSIMPNHYHLLLRESKEGGITDFIRRCNTSIAKYINTKTERAGPLFESNFKSKHIDSNNYLLHLSVYIHLNPLDFLDGEQWRENKLKDWKKKKARLLGYKWTSLKHYLMENFNDPIISGEEIILSQFNNKGDYENFLQEWSVENFNSISGVIIEN